MNLEQAYEIIEKGLNIANTKGVFVLRDATVVQQALDVLKGICVPDKPDEAKSEGLEVVTESTYKKSK